MHFVYEFCVIINERITIITIIHYSANTVKHRGGNIMQLGFFSFSGTGNLVKVQGIMKKEGYIRILGDNVKETAERLQT